MCYRTADSGRSRSAARASLRVIDRGVRSLLTKPMNAADGSSQRRFSIGRRRAALHGITPVEHDDDSEHRPGINDLRYVIQNNSDALSAGVPKFFMSVARQYRHQA